MGLVSDLKRKYDRWANKQEIAEIFPVSESIFEKALFIKAMSDLELINKTAEFKEKLKKGESLDNLLTEAFAVVREAVKRKLGKRPYEEQVWAGIAMHQGKIVEMKSGEGKTIAITMPAYLNALSGQGVHIITTNDYLAERDAQIVSPIFESLGLSAGVVAESMENNQRRENYKKDICYVSNKEVGFDYLRDNMVLNLKERVLRELHFGMIDEVDSILIDEARTPLIISQPAEHPEKEYFIKFANLAATLQEGADYEIDERLQTVVLTEEGEKRATQNLGESLDFLTDPTVQYHLHHALKAKAFYQCDRDYLVHNGKVILIDEFTGRQMPDRRLMEGLHQAIEAKEGVPIREKDQLLAKITFQNFFRLYKKWAGATGTAETAKDEFAKVYGKDVFVAPTHKPIQRFDFHDTFYLTEEAKFKFIAQETAYRHKKSQPVLIGARSVEKALKMSRELDKLDVPHQLLTAKHHQKEAEQIAEAGKEGMVTVATNMAGRGTDIILSPTIAESGGLRVIGTERHRAKRIDDQLRGRAGRQGDPGSSQFHISMEDELVQVFGSDELWQVIENMDPLEDRPFSNSFLQQEIDEAQQLAEALDFDSRRWLYQFDQVFDRQRAAIYKMRDKFLIQNDPKKREMILKMTDRLWQEYLDNFEQLQKGIGLVSFGGKDPLVEYALEAKRMFDVLVENIKIGATFLNIEI